MPREIDWEALELLRTEQENDTRFRELDRTLVPGEGDNPIAFVIGEAPGAQEVIKRRPFCGVSGLVQRMLMAHAGLHASGSRSNCWLTNVVKFRPPRNRKPYHVEIAAARPYLRREWIAVGAPTLIIPVGSTALQASMGLSAKVSILRVAGKRLTIPGNPHIECWPMIHPSYGLRVPEVRKLIEHDWTKLAEWMKDAGYRD